MLANNEVNMSVHAFQVVSPPSGAPGAAPAPSVPATPPGPLVMGVVTAMAIALILVALKQSRGGLDQRRAALVGGLLCFVAGFDGCVGLSHNYKAVQLDDVGMTLMFAAIVSLPGFIVGFLMGNKEPA